MRGGREGGVTRVRERPRPCPDSNAPPLCPRFKKCKIKYGCVSWKNIGGSIDIFPMWQSCLGFQIVDKSRKKIAL